MMEATESNPSSSYCQSTMHPYLRVFLILTGFASLSYVILRQVQSEEGHVPRTLSLDGIYLPEPGMEAELFVSLGFVPEPRLYPQSYHQGTELPVFVIAIGPDDIYNFHRFLGTFRIYFREKRLVVYNLGITGAERNMV
jgi:hypothetical protein